MNSSAPSGQVLGAAVSVLPATGAYMLLPQIQSEALYSAVVTIAGLWAISYIITAIGLKYIKN